MSKKGPRRVHSLHLILSVILLSFLLKTAFNYLSFDVCVCVCVCVRTHTQNVGNMELLLVVRVHGHQVRSSNFAVFTCSFRNTRKATKLRV